MNSVKLLTPSDIKFLNSIDNFFSSVDILCFGWSQDELESQVSYYRQSLQMPDYEGNENPLFEITDQEGVSYYVVFRSGGVGNEGFILSKDTNRLLVNAGGTFYRYLINERKVLSNECYQGIISSNFWERNSQIYFDSMAIPEYESMAIIDEEGVAAINWEGILWKQPIQFANAGYLEFRSFKDPYVLVDYCHPPHDPPNLLLSFHIQTGEYSPKVFSYFVER